jgi:hypothetical protein
MKNAQNTMKNEYNINMEVGKTSEQVRFKKKNFFF